MVAVFVHQVVGVASEVLPQLLHDLIHVLLREVRGAQDNGLPVGRAQAGGRATSAPCTCRLLHKHSLEFEGLSQLGRVAGIDLKDAAEGVRVAPVREFCRGGGAEVKQTSREERNHTGASDASAGLISSLDNYRRGSGCTLLA